MMRQRLHNSALGVCVASLTTRTVQ